MVSDVEVKGCWFNDFYNILFFVNFMSCFWLTYYLYTHVSFTDFNWCIPSMSLCSDEFFCVYEDVDILPRCKIFDQKLPLKYTW